ncbi:acetyl-CoA C-acyltransferase [Oceanicaulis alexandrii]|uniref:acetyl-CoA C-acyltransferase n=1 Tax=Oceanicaulis alexandrii TaxID=153233 RepID=UPI0003B5F5AB|nr:acetyl-CoA C-acyltransferase [Oceanicaulis alexandrii]
MDIYLYDAVRTPRGKAKSSGALASHTPHALVGKLIDALGARNGRDEVARAASLILGSVGQVGAQGGHLALVSRLHADLPASMRALTINNFCVSGLTAIRIAADEARSAGDDRLRLAGGVEMMSRVPFMGDQAFYYADPETARALRYVPVALSADLMATREGFQKADLDTVTARSHQRAAAAFERGRLEEIVPVASAEVVLDHDEPVRPDTTVETLAKMEPAFTGLGATGFDALMLENRPEVSEIRHVHSAANCPPPCDGAALALIGSKAAGEAAGLKPKARILAISEVTGDPVLQLTSGFDAMDALLSQSGLSLSDFDRIEFMEAFAAPPLKFERDYAPDMDRVNPEGGHLAMGHPMGASGAILAATALSGLARQDGALGLVVTHGGSGVGAAMAIERL